MRVSSSQNEWKKIWSVGLFEYNLYVKILILIHFSKLVILVIKKLRNTGIALIWISKSLTKDLFIGVQGQLKLTNVTMRLENYNWKLRVIKNKAINKTQNQTKQKYVRINTHTESAHGPPGQNDLFPRSETAFPDCQLDGSKTGKMEEVMSDWVSELKLSFLKDLH